MKDIKSYVIGFLSCFCLFLIMGQTDGEEMMQWNVDGKVVVEDVEGDLVIEASENGRYQGFADKGKLYLVDTTTGQLFYEKKEKKEKRWQQIIKPNNLYGAPMYTK